LELLTTGRVRVEDLISHRLSLDQFEHGVSLMETGSDSVMKVMMIPA
jgi:threonine dehydrogenase-like Zn-dependent dehydrogenase